MSTLFFYYTLYVCRSALYALPHLSLIDWFHNMIHNCNQQQQHITCRWAKRNRNTDLKKKEMDSFTVTVNITISWSTSMMKNMLSFQVTPVKMLKAPADRFCCQPAAILFPVEKQTCSNLSPKNKKKTNQEEMCMRFCCRVFLPVPSHLP